MLSPAAKNLEDKFDRGEEVLGYFDVQKARVIRPGSRETGVKTKFAYPAKRNSQRRAASGRNQRYRKNK
jgi:hypothetical protein